MKLTIPGTAQATIYISNTMQLKDVDVNRDAALFADILYYTLPEGFLAQVINNIAKKTIDKSADAKIHEILSKGEPAFSIIYPSGNRIIANRDEFEEAFDIELNDEKEELDPDFNEDDEYDNPPSGHEG